MIRRGNGSKAANSIVPVHGLFLLLLLTVLPLLLQGCGAAGFDAIRPGLESRGHYIDKVPFFKQTEYDCGPAALAGVLAFQGMTVDLAKIRADVYLPKLRGTLPMDMERYARDRGLAVASSAGSADTLKAAVRNNTPAICLLDLGFWLYRRPHYVTIIGFDDGNGLFIMHDGVTPDRTMAYGRFEKAWARAGNWMIVITPGR